MVVQAPGGPDEDTSGGFIRGGWQAPYDDEEAGRLIVEEIEGYDALLLGRRTYDIFANYWPKQTSENPIARKLNAMPKYIASRTLKTLEWENSTLLGPDLREELEKIKSKHDQTHVIGSANLMQSLLKAQLVDRHHLWLHPLTLGSGKRVFEDGTVPATWELARSHIFKNGVVLLTYDRQGVPTYGTVGE